MNKNITISVEEYKELLLKERPSENNKMIFENGYFREEE
jgi:hypothetical protein